MLNALRKMSTSTQKKPVIAIAGITGAVGQELLDLITERNFPFAELRPLASKRSAGKTFDFQNKTYTIQELKEDSFEGCDIAFFSAGGSISKKFAPIAGKAKSNGIYMDKNIVIDNSSAFRMTENIPLVVPEVNSSALSGLKDLDSKIVANPNCSTIIMNLAVYPLVKTHGVNRVVVSTYQAASGAGAEAMRELETQCKQFGEGKRGDELEQSIFGKQYIFNLFSHNSGIDQESGYNEEEIKMVKETKKIFGDDDIKVTATCVRVPVLRAHCESINVALKKPITVDEAKDILSKADGVSVMDDRVNNEHPEPIKVSGKDDVYVGRIRMDVSQDNNQGLEMFVAGDQIRKGAALNAIQIAEAIIEGKY
eukprot:snap_masked-scaffold_1-processed-gene-3.9-mRNA-1 protein AED:0.14 eAED:0.15 QI:0/-1/0/1/-1/1/1/0/366